ncbi:alkene reductase [Streptomyces sp. NPDC002506]|uniref:alkene reductase n=1 Tax=Streptomyces sp. NPDC002506 TaxID=3154536 RepID=UPI00332E826D
MTTAFDSIDLAGTPLTNRIALAPMTRSRATGPGNSPTASTAEYYAQRASAGLLITEGVQPSVVGQGYPDTPGLHSDEQIAAWRKVTDAVHAKGGRIFAQLMHAGRIGHPDLLPGDLINVGPSAVAAEGQVFTHEGPKPFITPQALSEDQIQVTIGDFAAAARNAIEAGFDGVELHGANGYLIHQFLAPNSNVRADGWGGSVEGHIRFAVEVTKAVAAAIGPERTAIRLSPGNPYNGTVEPEPEPVYTALVAALEPLGLAYLHVLEVAPQQRELTLRLRKAFSGVFVLNAATEGPTGPDALALIEDGTADLISYGALFLANPDLPARLRAGGPFNAPDPSTFFGGDDRGYLDYPTLDADAPLDAPRTAPLDA